MNNLPLIIGFLWDTQAIIDIQRVFGSTWVRPAEWVSLLGDFRAILVFIAAMLWIVGRERAYGVLGAVMLAAVVGSLMKMVIDLPRPEASGLTIYDGGTSSAFPSGHSLAAAALWGSLALFGYIKVSVAVVIVVLVGFTRVYLGSHYLGDVLIGSLIGLVVVFAFARIWPVVTRYIPMRRIDFSLGLLLSGSLLIVPLFGVTAFTWETFGAQVGAGIGIVIESRRVRFVPFRVPLVQQIVKIIIGVGGLALALLAAWLIDNPSPALLVAVFGVGAIWLVLGAPVLFIKMGLGNMEVRSDDPEPPPARSTAIGQLARSTANGKVDSHRT